MVLTVTGKNVVRDLINTNKDYGELGTSGTAATEADTGLVAAVAATQTALTSSTSSKQITLTYELNSVTGNGNTYQEVQNTLSSGTNFNRTTFAGVAKTGAIEIQVITTFTFV